MKFSLHNLVLACLLNIVCASSLVSVQASPQKAFSTLDSASFFESGRLRSEDRLLLQRRRNNNIPVSGQSNSWQFIIFKAGGVSFWMPPGVITEETVSLDTSVGKIRFRTLASNTDDRRYVAAYADSLTEAQIKNPKVLLNAIREKVAPAKQFKFTQQDAIKLNNYPGRELKFEDADERIVIRVYLVENRVYALGIRYPKAKPQPRQTNAFLNALELLTSS